MKKGISILSVLIIMVFSNNLSAQFSFGVSPGFNLNGAYFGYKINKFVPYIGFQYFNAGYTLSETGKRVNYNNNQIEDYKDEINISGGLIIPSLGVKYFFLSQNKINAYGNLLISKPIIYGKATEDGEPVEDFNNQIKNTNIWAGGLGFGVEYNFSDNFSIGGEFGIRYFTGNYFESEDRTINDPNTGQPITYKKEISGNANFSPTYTKITLNYYFGKKKEE